MTTHGVTRQDPYFWMRDRENPEVIAYLHAENAFLEAQIAHLAPLRATLFEEMKGRMKPREESAPLFVDGWFYYARYEEGKEYPIHARKWQSLDAPEDILLDVNLLAEGHPYCAVMGSKVSADHRYLAYAVDFQGRRICDLYILDLHTRQLLPEVINGVTGNLTWAMDHQTLFYTTMDPDTLRANRIFRHRLGQAAEQDDLVFEENDETFNCGIGRSSSKQFLFIQSSSTLTDEAWILDAYQPDGEFRVFRARERGHEYSIDHFDGLFYILSNEHAVNFQLLTCPDTATEPANWAIRVLHREDTLLEGFELFEQELVIDERRNGLSQIRILSRIGGQRDEYLVFNDPTYTCGLDHHPDPMRPVLRYHYQSLTTPATIFERDLRTGEEKIVWQKEVIGSFQPGDYRSERIFATAPDGTRVPVSMVYHRETPLDGSAPLLLYGYGSYGMSMDPYFSLSRLSLLNRGFIFAIAHIRGGSDMGRTWYEQGRQMQKWNTFTDFIACAEAVIQAGYTTADRLCCMGGSAGGLLLGAVLNTRPDLFAAAVAQVPFVDVVTTMLDDTIPLTTGEYDEWGNPNEKEAFDYMLSYSPYDQVKEQPYPALLVTSGLHDSQVQYWEPTKWVARLRDMQQGDNPILLFTNMDAGHGGASGRFESLKEVALEYAFLLDRVGKAGGN